MQESTTTDAADAGAHAKMLLSRQLSEAGDSEGARVLLEEAARTGDLTARVVLARHCLAVEPYRLSEGLRLLQETSRAGHPEATHVLAVYRAAGAGLPQSWPQAFDDLALAARQGHQIAQAALAGLAGEWNLSIALREGEKKDTRDWTALRARIDTDALLAMATKGIVSRSPRIAVVPDFASPEICDWLVWRARPRLKPATTYDQMTADSVSREGRSNSDCQFALIDSDVILGLVRARIAIACELPVGAMEAPTVLHYAPGQQFSPHYDFLDPALPGYAKDLARGGQRVLTFLLPLNDGYEGGETEFPLLGTRYKGRRGNALFFWNVEPNGAIDKRTLHAGAPPTSGEKWMLSQWVRERLGTQS